LNDEIRKVEVIEILRPSFPADLFLASVTLSTIRLSPSSKPRHAYHGGKFNFPNGASYLEQVKQHNHPQGANFKNKCFRLAIGRPSNEMRFVAPEIRSILG
jgi:hypothetical protein